jgi:glycerol kinase
MSRFVGAIDQGTTSTRFILVDAAGDIRAMAQREHAQLCPVPGWVEHDGAEILRNTRVAIDEALASTGVGAGDLAAVGVTHQRETCLLWDRVTGAPLHNALVWMDTRTRPLVERYASRGVGDLVRAKTGLPLATYFSVLKLVWLFDNVPGARAKAERGDALFGTIDAWLIYSLTGRHVTDATNASRTQLMNLRSLAWDDELLALFDIPRACLPDIRPSSEIYGVCTGALAGVPLAGALGDQHAALLGQAGVAPGDVKNTYGTGCFLLMNTGATPHVSQAGLLTTLGYWLGADKKPVYALEGSIAVAGALVQWLRDNLGIIQTSAEIEALAASVPDNGDVYFVPAFSGLYAPRWRKDARGIVAGLTRFSNKGHIARAALEAAAFQTRELVAAMAKDAGAPLAELRVDGGMAANELLMQFQADILGAPLARGRTLETTALGAAYAAGLAVGYWPSVDAIADHWRAEKRWSPRMDSMRREMLIVGWEKAVERSLGWAG